MYVILFRVFYDTLASNEKEKLFVLCRSGARARAVSFPNKYKSTEFCSRKLYTRFSYNVHYSVLSFSALRARKKYVRYFSRFFFFLSRVRYDNLILFLLLSRAYGIWNITRDKIYESIPQLLPTYLSIYLLSMTNFFNFPICR